MKLKVQTRRTSDLSEDPANLRVHPERSVEAVKASLRRFGLQHPILVDSKGIVRAGNARLRAARELGWETIEVVVSDLPDHELVAYSVSDNRTAELSHFNAEALAAQLKAMPDDADRSAVGFSAEDFAELLRSVSFDSDADMRAAMEGLAKNDGTGLRVMSFGFSAERYDEINQAIDVAANATDPDVEALTSIGEPLRSAKLAVIIARARQAVG